jgi:hypothetical protein
VPVKFVLDFAPDIFAIKQQHMIISESQKSEITKRRNMMSQARSVLKAEFVGLDAIIDDVMDTLQPWFLFPAGQLRPTIINLFGMTGTGKTSLVKRISELLNMSNKMFKFDAGDYCSGELRLRYEISSKLKNHEKQPVIMAFDEFQLGRTITESGTEQDRNGLRAVWDLLDTGKFSIIYENYYASKLATIIIKLDECVRNGVEAKNGVITKNIKFHNDIFYPEGRLKNKKEKKITKRPSNDDGEIDKELFVPEEFHYNIHSILEKEILNEASVASKLLKMDENQILEFLYRTIEKGTEPVEHDFSQAVIFILGNIDEAYAMTENVDPDFDADIFYKNSLKITVTQIKNALLKRFRAEQIARLGNNFIIYPSFSSDSYRKLISIEMNRVVNNVQKSFGITIDFDYSVNEIIYKEGVFPTQGTRPVFTTINSLIETYVCKIVSFIAEKNPEIVRVKWSYFDDNYLVVFFDDKDNKVASESYGIKLKVENLRRSSMDEEQANTAVHEAGHAVLCSLLMGLIPDEIVSKTAGMSHGYCRTEMPLFKTKSFLKKDISVSLGGYLAETLVFGDENMTTGAHSDIEHATSIAIEYVRSYGMSKIPVKISAPDIQFNEHGCFSYEESDIEAKRLIDKCKKTALKCIEDNMLLLLKLSEYLSVNSKMNKQQIEEYVKKYNSYGIVTFKTKDNYYDFKNIIKNKLSMITMITKKKPSTLFSR